MIEFIIDIVISFIEFDCFLFFKSHSVRLIDCLSTLTAFSSRIHFIGLNLIFVSFEYQIYLSITNILIFSDVKLWIIFNFMIIVVSFALEYVPSCPPTH